MQLVSINIENTNTPSIIKFVASTMLTDGSFEYNTIEDANNSELVQQLFHLPFVKKYLLLQIL